MADNNGIFSDLFNAVGTPIQNVADLVGDGFNAATSIAQTPLQSLWNDRNQHGKHRHSDYPGSCNRHLISHRPEKVNITSHYKPPYAIWSKVVLSFH